MRAVSVTPLWDWVSRMLMWHLGSEVNVTGVNGSGQGTDRTLIITVITSSPFLSPILHEVNLIQPQNRLYQYTYAHLIILTMMLLASDAEQINGKKEGM